MLSLTTEERLERFQRPGYPLGVKQAQKRSQAAPRALLPPRPVPEVHLRLCQRERKRIDVSQPELDDLTDQLVTLVRPTPATHLAGMPGASAPLTAQCVAAVEDWQRFPSGRERWATAGFTPRQSRSGTSGYTSPNVAKIGCPHLRQALYRLTTSVVWQEPTFGMPCFERPLQGQPFGPTIMHLGRKLANTAVAILKTAQPFRARSADPQAATDHVRRVQTKYQACKRVPPPRGEAMP